MISHRMICWNVLNTVIHDLNHDDIYLNVFPLFHAGGLFAYLSSADRLRQHHHPHAPVRPRRRCWT